ncbi:MAG: alpha/beta fold hydrolase [Kutzneria sp.]|nr:alpha/beta fold hydrolase [Kutzneria sp.]
MTVPADWARPDGPMMTLALVRRNATDTAHRVGALLINPGGPGVSGTQVVLHPEFFPFSPELRSRFDIVGFDPRGIASSPPLHCPAPADDQATVGDIPANQQEFAALLAHNQKTAAACTDRLSAADVARDVEGIRTALGGEPLNWYGTSYGTEIGQQYAELFPSHIRTMVLDATIDHTRSALDHLYDATRSAEDAFDRFAKWCHDNTACALHGQDVAVIFDKIRAKLTGDQRDYLDYGTYLSLYKPAQGWPALGEQLAKYLTTPPTATGRNSTPTPPTNSAVDAATCQDWNYTVDNYTQLSKVLTTAGVLAPHLRIANVDRYRLVDCQGWPVIDPPHALRVHGAPPILVVNSMHDPITPYWGAANISRQLPGSVLLTYEGAGHGSYSQSDCVRTDVDRYLSDRAMPAPGTRCPDVMPG